MKKWSELFNRKKNSFLYAKPHNLQIEILKIKKTKLEYFYLSMYLLNLHAIYLLHLYKIINKIFIYLLKETVNSRSML